MKFYVNVMNGVELIKWKIRLSEAVGTESEEDWIERTFRDRNVGREDRTFATG